MFRLLPALLVFACSILDAQNQSFEIKYLNPKTGYPGLITLDINAQDAPSLENPALWFRSHLNANSDFSFKYLGASNGPNGFKHLRYQQIYKGYAIEGAEVVLHLKSGKVVSVNGRYLPNLRVNTQIALGMEDALKRVMDLYPGAVFQWQVPAEERLLKLVRNNSSATYRPKPELLIYSNNDSGKNEHFRMAYKIDLYVHEPRTRQMIYLDAITGEVLDQYEQICSIDKVGIAHTKYSGIREIQTDSVGTDSFILHDHTRGKGILTLDSRVLSITDSSRNFIDTDNIWDNINQYQDEVATDVHWGSAVTYDFYKKFFNRDSYDDSGSMILSNVHVNVNYNNAYWDGVSANYGDGDGVKLMPLVSLDICAHELTHGITGNTARLRYRRESGALNESFSDIFCKAIEQDLDTGNFTWYIADKITVGQGKPFRNLSDPSEFNHPNYYQGINYYNGNNDNGGVHTNSGVQNYWFYLLCVGGSGTREDGKPFTVGPIGYERAIRIAYSNLSGYLTAFSEYIDAAYFSIDAANAMYGQNSYESQQVENAWYAVGLFEKTSLQSIDSEQSKWAVMPNPGNAQIRLINSANTPAESFTIVDVLGKTVLSGSVNSGEPIDVSGLETGLYFVRIGTSCIKWIKME